MFIIALVGKAKSGKDYLASFVASKITNKVYIISFADKLKKIANVLLNLPSDHQWTQEFKVKELPKKWQTNNIKTARDFLQHLGTNAIRDNLSANTFINCLTDEIDKIYNKSPSAIIFITDIRFKNEANTIRAMPYDCKFIKIIRNNASLVSLTSINKSSKHISEKELENIKCDIKFNNTFDTTAKERFMQIVNNFLYIKNK